MSNEDSLPTGSQTIGSQAIGSDRTPPQTISLIAGIGHNGEPVMENIFVTAVDSEVALKLANHASNKSLRSRSSAGSGLLANDFGKSTRSGGDEFRLLKSPAFIRNLAAGDKICYPGNNASGYDLVKRSGNLSIRVLRKEGIEEVASFLTPELELLDGVLDLQSSRLLVYTIHVSIGFQQIEDLLEGATSQFPGVVWYYGNVYDPTDGVTPLNWWQEFLAPV